MASESDVLVDSRETPDADALRANWLPALAGPFVVVLRAYLPRPELLEGRAEMPTVIRL